jgi:hypothetical protein
VFSEPPELLGLHTMISEPAELSEPSELFGLLCMREIEYVCESMQLNQDTEI